MSPLLVVDGLATTFTTRDGDVRAVDGVSFALERGRTLGVVGESGSGKSVMIRSVMGLLPPTGVEWAGRVLFDGAEVPRDRRAARRLWGAEMGIVFQDPMRSLNPVMRVGAQVAEPLRQHVGLGRADAAREAVELIRAVGIPDPERRAREYPAQLSGGMCQRVMIAIAVAGRPRLLFADEPSTALDVTVQAQILRLLARQQRERHMAMVFVTHDLAVAALVADEVAVMYAGRIVERAPVTALFDAPRHPYTAALLRSSPRLDWPSHRRLDAIDGRPPSPSEAAAGCRFAPRCPRAQARCRSEEPPLAGAADVEGEGEDAHVYRCWYPLPGGADG